jgi:autotransporter passenger strand-loop-strand repeat protein
MANTVQVSSATSGTVVSSGGTDTIDGNGTNYSATVESGGTIFALGSGVISAATILSGGVALVGAGGTAASVVVISGGIETISANGALAGTLISGGTVQLLSGAVSSGTITFAGAGGRLVVSDTLPSTDALAGFTSGSKDSVVFAGTPYVTGATASFAAGTITIVDGGSHFIVNDPAGSAATPFRIIDDQGAAELIPCFVAGTRILTPKGEVAVEALAIGDIVVTVRPGGALTSKVVWTGCRTLDVGRHGNPAMVRPVRILAGAFGGGIPERDLRLSPHHAVYIDGHLFEAIALVNGLTILPDQVDGIVIYHHIELETHDILLAEGLAVESFLDTGNRDMFESPNGALRLHPNWRTPVSAETCVPLHRAGPEVEQARETLLARAHAFSGESAVRLHGRALS